MDIEELIEEFHDVMKSACNESFRTRRDSKKAMSNKSVPWWTEELTIMRKMVNALRRKYQRTRNSEELREQRKTLYLEGKARYLATVQKEYCNMTSSTNPWNEEYKLAAGMRKNSTQITRLRKPDGSLTADLCETLRHMLEYFTQEDKEDDDSDNHQLARIQSQEPVDTADDKDFTVEEIRNTIESMGNKKAPGKDGITGDVYKFFRKFYQLYNSHVQRVFKKRSFPRTVEKSNTCTNYKTWDRKQRRRF